MTLTASPEWPAMGRVHARPRHHDGERRGQGGGNDAVDASTSERGSASPTFGPKMSRARDGNFVATCISFPEKRPLEEWTKFSRGLYGL